MHKSCLQLYKKALKIYSEEFNGIIKIYISERGGEFKKYLLVF